MTLTPAQIDSFAERGYLLVPGLFDAASIAELRRWTGELEAAPERPGFCMVYGEPSLVDPGKRIVQRIENFCPFHSAFDRFLTRGRLNECVDLLFGERAVLFKDARADVAPAADRPAARGNRACPRGQRQLAPRHHREAIRH